ncbi:unnamed protein product [Psylliodes chrysocephalus]|uniref:Transposase n=1 Tax=Psylliodes chrysocephalus TaxID=3402493 RepID=A0A9P0CUZ6_9CUCU|nr:unnamed protein product [Psylliodes chrysocephala]
MAEHSSVKKRRTRYQVPHTDNEINVLAQIHINPENSTRRIAKECVVGTSTVKRILKKHKCHGYKFQKVQKLHAGDSDRRLIFCHSTMNPNSREMKCLEMVFKPTPPYKPVNLPSNGPSTSKCAEVIKTEYSNLKSDELALNNIPILIIQSDEDLLPNGDLIQLDSTVKNKTFKCIHA